MSFYVISSGEMSQVCPLTVDFLTNSFITVLEVLDFGTELITIPIIYHEDTKIIQLCFCTHAV